MSVPKYYKLFYGLRSVISGFIGTKMNGNHNIANSKYKALSFNGRLECENLEAEDILMNGDMVGLNLNCKHLLSNGSLNIK